MAGWTFLRDLVQYEFTQSKEEGRDSAAVDALRPQWEAAGHDYDRLMKVWDQLQALPIRRDFPFDEPNDLPTIRSKRPAGPRRIPFQGDDAALFDRMYGAWLGRCAGCALGKPVEGFMGGKEGLTSRDRIKTYLKAIGPHEYPLNYYFPQYSPAEETSGKVHCPLSTREQIAFMETDDDIRYTVLGQVILRRFGHSFTTEHVTRAWLDYLPFSMVCTAETQAYRNVVWRYGRRWGGKNDPPLDFDWVSTFQNPYREWIGAQIRADSFGYGAPGNPELAAEYGWRDARLSHVKNGIYGEMLVAAMIAAAFALDDPRQIVEAALAEIPVSSRLYQDMRRTVDICTAHRNDPAQFEAVLDAIYAEFGHYHPVHTNNNAALVVAAVLLGGHDFEKVITISVMGGWDTDCNGATAGSIAGARLGAKALPEKWIAPLHDTLNSAIIEYHPIAISECARRSVEIARKAP